MKRFTIECLLDLVFETKNDFETALMNIDAAVDWKVQVVLPDGSIHTALLSNLKKLRPLEFDGEEVQEVSQPFIQPQIHYLLRRKCKYHSAIYDTTKTKK